MQLNLKIAPSDLPKPRPKVPSFGFVRELSEPEALSYAAGEYAPLPAVTSIRAIRERHHWVAQLLATDTPTEDVSAITGFSPQRLKMFQADPAFCELMEHYRKQSGKAPYLGTSERLGYLAATIVDELTSRLEDAPEDISLKDLTRVAEVVLDRAGHGKTATLNIHHGDAVKSVLEELRLKRAAEAAEGIIDAEFSPVPAGQSGDAAPGKLLQSAADGVGTEDQPGEAGSRQPV